MFVFSVDRVPDPTIAERNDYHVNVSRFPVGRGSKENTVRFFEKCFFATRVARERPTVRSLIIILFFFLRLDERRTGRRLARYDVYTSNLTRYDVTPRSGGVLNPRERMYLIYITERA